MKEKSLASLNGLGTLAGSLLVALAVAHEMSNRFGRAMDYLRDTRDGKVTPPRVFGYSSTIFGATAAIALVKGAKNPEAGKKLIDFATSAAISEYTPNICRLSPTNTVPTYHANVVRMSVPNCDVSENTNPNTPNGASAIAN